MSWMERANALRDELVAWRRDLHMYPELGFQEVRTAGIVAAELQRLSYQVQTGIAQTGVVGWISSDRPGPVVLLRFDMDCLPVQEENEVPYVSRIDGLMHACGHDGHVAVGLGAATLLAKHRQEWAGTMKLMFQPGEEGLNGAEVMVREGVLDRIGPPVSIAMAIHLWNSIPLGQVGISAGPVMAAAQDWKCIVRGRGGHGAAPHLAIDPTVAAAQLILAWQTVVSRNVDPQQEAVLSVGTIRAGEAFNVIPDTVMLRGTVRAFDSQVREAVLRRMEEIATGLCGAFGCTVSLEHMPLAPALINDAAVTAVIRRAAVDILGEENIVGMRTMTSEDMAFVNDLIPGSYAFVGSRNESAGLVNDHHNSRFDFDEGAMPLAVALLTAAATDYTRS